jgi:hypothetical protein
VEGIYAYTDADDEWCACCYRYMNKVGLVGQTRWIFVILLYYYRSPARPPACLPDFHQRLTSTINHRHAHFIDTTRHDDPSRLSFNFPTLLKALGLIPL